MASGSIAGPVVTPKRSDYKQRKWHGQVNWSRADYTTYCTIATDLYFITDYGGDWGQVGNYLRGYLKINGTQGLTYNGASWVAKSGADRYMGSYSASFSRTTYAYNVSIEGSVWLTETSAYDNGSSYTSTSITIPALPSYTIAFNANGGSGNTGSKTKYYNVAITTNAAPSRTGYRFAGWFWKNTGSAVGASTSWNGANESNTFYAHWTPNTYTIAYDGNGNTGGSTASSSHTYDVTANLNTNGFVKKDHVFLGWATSPNGPVVYSDGASVRNLTATHGATVTLYAKWRFQYTKPTFSFPSSYRISWNTNSEQQDYFVEDESGRDANVSITVTPVLKETSLNNYEFINTQVSLRYVMANQSEETVVPINPTESDLVYYYEINEPTTLSWQTKTHTLEEDNQYNFTILVQAIEDDEVKEDSSANTFISSATYIVDINPNSNTVGIFSSAPEKDKWVILGVEGDLVFSIHDDIADPYATGLSDVEKAEALIWRGIQALGIETADSNTNS